MPDKKIYALMLKSYPHILNIHELCEGLATSTKTGYKLLREEKISSVKVGRTYRIPKFSLLSYMKIMNPPQCG